MKNQNKSVRLVIVSLCLLCFSGCTATQDAVPDDSQVDEQETTSDDAISIPVSEPISIPKYSDEYNHIVPLCDDSMIPTVEEMADWESVTDDIIKVRIHYPKGWIITLRDDDSTRYNGIPEYTLLNIPGSIGSISEQVRVGIHISENDKQPSEYLLDTIVRHSDVAGTP